MRALVLCLCVVGGCSKKSEPKHEPPTGPGTGEAAKPAEPTVQPAKPDSPPQPAAAAAAPSVNCDEIVTAADIEKHCKAKVEIGPSPHEGKMGVLGVCARVMSDVGKKFPIAQWKLAVYNSAADAQSNIKLDKLDGSKDVTGIGDTAWTQVSEHKQLGSTMTSVGVHKGRNILWLGFTKDSLNTKPPCTLDQLVEVARDAASRLP